MIYGIGTDIVEVARIEAALAEFGNDFAERILADAEHTAFHDSRIKARFLAKRFAAKEAFSKAMGTGIRGTITFQNIAITHDAMGKPLLSLSDSIQAILDQHHICAAHLSISDEKNLAAAFVVLETNAP